jgi:hypothetical protein
MGNGSSLTAALIRRGTVAPEAAARLEERTNGSARALRQLLIEEGLLSEAGLAEVLAEQEGVPSISIAWTSMRSRPSPSNGCGSMGLCRWKSVTAS